MASDFDKVVEMQKEKLLNEQLDQMSYEELTGRANKERREYRFLGVFGIVMIILCIILLLYSFIAFLLGNLQGKAMLIIGIILGCMCLLFLIATLYSFAHSKKDDRELAKENLERPWPFNKYKAKPKKQNQPKPRVVRTGRNDNVDKFDCSKNRD